MPSKWRDLDLSEQPGDLLHDLAGYLAAQVTAVVVIAQHGLNRGVARELAHGPDVAVGGIKCRRNAGVAEPVRPQLDPKPRPDRGDNVVHSIARKAAAIEQPASLANL